MNLIELDDGAFDGDRGAAADGDLSGAKINARWTHGNGAAPHGEVCGIGGLDKDRLGVVAAGLGDGQGRLLWL